MASAITTIMNPAPIVYVSNVAIARVHAAAEPVRSRVRRRIGRNFQRRGEKRYQSNPRVHLRIPPEPRPERGELARSGRPRIHLQSALSTTTGWAQPSAVPSSRTSCSISETSNTTRSASRPFPVRRLLAPTAAGYSTLNNMAGLSQTNLSADGEIHSGCGDQRQGTISVLGRQIPVGSIAFTIPSTPTTTTRSWRSTTT